MACPSPLPAPGGEISAAETVFRANLPLGRVADADRIAALAGSGRHRAAVARLRGVDPEPEPSLPDGPRGSWRETPGGGRPAGRS